MRKVWIVVANGGLARIYNADGAGKLVEVQTLIHPQSHMLEQDLVSDKPGRNNSRFGYGRSQMDPQTLATDKEKHLFAKQLADALSKGCEERAYEHLHLISSPEFLGHVRSELSGNVQKCIASETHKDLTSHSLEDIRSYLPPVL